MLSSVANDFRLAARRLIAAPLFSTFAIVSLAVGVGVTTVAYSIVADLFFAGLRVRHPESIVMIMAPAAGRLPPASLTDAEFEELRRAQRTLSTVAASAQFRTAVSTADMTVHAAAEEVSGDYFNTIGVDAILGRTIQAADEASRAPITVLGGRMWRERFSSDPGVIGRVVRIAGQPFEVVGVLPESYTGLNAAPVALNGTGLWVPLGTARALASSGEQPAPRGEARLLTVIGRLATAAATAAVDVATIATALDAAQPSTTAEGGAGRLQGRRWTVRTLKEVRAERNDPTRLGFVLGGLVTLVLVVACTNLANLVLARGTARAQDFAVRRALGAGRWRLVREQMAESLIIAAAGAAAAYGVMRVTAAVAARDLPLFAGFTLSIRPHIDAATVAIAGAALAVALVVFGLEPAIRLAHTSNLRDPLATTAARMGRLGRYRMILRWQVAVAAAFFILATMAVRYVVADFRHDPGLRLDGLVVAQLDLDPQRWDDRGARRLLAELTEAARQTRGVQSVAVSTGLPFGTASPHVRVSRPEQGGPSATATLVAGTPNLLSVIGVPILHGRSFDDRDGEGTAGVVVVSERAAHALFGTSDVVGRELVMQTVREATQEPPALVTIAGVARDTDTNYYMRQPREPVIYAPLAQARARPVTLVARAAGDDAAAIRALQIAIRRTDPDLPVLGIGGGWEMLAGPFTFVRFAGTASLWLGLLTLVLAMVGLYGIQSQGVTLRRREIGVRLSLGATAAGIRRMVWRDGFRPVVEGLGLGLAAGIAGRVMTRTLLDIPLQVLDPWMLAVVPIPVMLAAFCACFVPARRAAAVEPNIVLREV